MCDEWSDFDDHRERGRSRLHYGSQASSQHETLCCFHYWMRTANLYYNEIKLGSNPFSRT